MAKGKKSAGFNLKDTGNIPDAPSSKALGVPAAPARSTMGEDAVRQSVAKNPSSG